MSPAGIAILIGAGPTSGAGIARILASPTHGNLAVALLARNPENLAKLTEGVRQSSKGGVLEAFPCDTRPENLSRTFEQIGHHPSFNGLKLKLAIYHVKHSSKQPFLEQTPAAFGQALQEYTTGSYAFAQESLKMMYAHHGGQTLLSETAGQKKGTIIFTGTLGALRTNAEYNSYGASRAGSRMVAQGVAKEVSKFGVHVVHAIANGSIRDEDSTETKEGARMSAEAVGNTYLWLSQMSPSLWIHELDMRPAQEKF